MATEYERKRLENIRRNDEMMAALNVRAKASLLTAATKRPREESTKSYKKKEKPETPIVMRKSLRTRGLDPDSVGLPNWFSDFPKRITSPPSQYSSAPLQKSSARLLAPLPFDKAYDGEGSCKKLIETMLRSASKSIDDSPIDSSSTRRRSSRLSNAVVQKEELVSSSCFVKKVAFAKKSCRGKMVTKDENDDSPMSSGNDCLKKEVVKPEKIEFDGEPLSLEPHNVARVVPGRILVVKLIPCQNVKLVAAGDKLGNVGFWNLDCQGEEDDDDGIYLFRPHTAPVSSLVFQQNSLSKVISSSYDGLIRLMDVEKSVFDLVYSSDDAIFSLSQRPNDEQSLYFSAGYGMLNVWDLRAGKSVFNWDDLHEHRINSIDFSSQNPHVMATSSTDGNACLWDLRSIGATTPKTLKTVNHSRAVHSAYFSPSGLSLATTSVDNYIGLLSGTNFEDISMISHDNATNRVRATNVGIESFSSPFATNLATLQSQIGYNFTNLNLLRRAMTHASFSQENNKALSIFGSHLIETSVSLHLLSKDIDTSSKALTRLIAEVSNVDSSCALDGNRLGLERVIRVSPKTDASNSAIVCGGFRAIFGAVAIDSGMVDEAIKVFWKVHGDRGWILVSVL